MAPAESDDAPTGSGGFVERWARRKAEPRTTEAAPTVEPPLSVAEIEEIVARLPSLDSIDATLDVAPFLVRGVPQPLRNAALHRLWRADPAIRDRIPDAIDYAEDYLRPETIAGWGAAPPGAADALVERLHAQLSVKPAANDLGPKMPAEREGKPKEDALPPDGDSTSAPAAGEAATRRRHGGALPADDEVT